MDDAAVQQAVEDVAAVAHRQDVIRVAHVMSHDVSHGEPVKRNKFFNYYKTFGNQPKKTLFQAVGKLFRKELLLYEC